MTRADPHRLAHLRDVSIRAGLLAIAAQQAYLHALAGRDGEAEARYRWVVDKLAALSCVVEAANAPEREGE